jgi:hypothetical protein
VIAIITTQLEGSSYLQKPATDPYLATERSTPKPLHPASLRSILIPSSLGLPSGLFPPGLPTKTLYKFLSHACHMSRPPGPCYQIGTIGTLPKAYDISNAYEGKYESKNTNKEVKPEKFY